MAPDQNITSKVKKLLINKYQNNFKNPILPSKVLKVCFLSLFQACEAQGGLLSGHGEHQGLLVFLFAEDVRQHEGGEEAELHSEAELEQLQVDAEHPFKHSWQETVKVVSLHKQYDVWRFQVKDQSNNLQKLHLLPACVCSYQIVKCLAALTNPRTPAPVKDTADGEDDLKDSGDDAERVEDPLVSRQDAQPGEGRQDGGVEADTHEAESSSQVVKQGQVTCLEHISV